MTVQAQKELITVDEYYRMAEEGILKRDDRVELIEGEIIPMVPIGSAHASSVYRLIHLFTKHIGDRAIVGAQNPVRLSNITEPQPDFAILKMRSDFYRDSHPSPRDVLLIIEVAQSSTLYDRDKKKPIYARHGIPEYWIVDLNQNLIEIYRDARDGQYQQKEIRYKNETVSPEAFPEIELKVEDIIG